MANNLGVNSYTVGGDYDVWGDKFLADMAILNKFAGDTFVVGATSGPVVIDVEDCQNFSIRANGGTASQVDIRVPDLIARYWYVRNDRVSGAITIRCAAGGDTITLAAGDRRLIYSDGTNCADLTLASLGIASVTGLQAALDAKLALAGGTMLGALTLAADPANALHAATKQYVDSLAANVGKRSRVRVATTANVTISTALNNADSLDGVTLATGDLVLVKNQSSAAENGVYVVGVAPARSSEFDTYDEHPGTLFSVAEGTTNADTLWLCTSNAGGTLNSTSIAFSQVNVVQAASDTVAGIVELATNAETATGADATRAVTPAGLASLNPARLDTADQTVTGGARVTSLALNGGNPVTTGTLTLDPGDRPLQHYTNGGAHTLAPGSNTGSLILDITNNGSAGAITTSGFTKVVGAFTTTNAHKFRCSITVGNGGSLLSIQALQ